jgi:hypothetical protein
MSAVHAHRFAGAGRTGDEHMRQLGDVADNAVAADILADCERDLRTCCFLKAGESMTSRA